MHSNHPPSLLLAALAREQQGSTLLPDPTPPQPPLPPEPPLPPKPTTKVRRSLGVIRLRLQPVCCPDGADPTFGTTI